MEEELLKYKIPLQGVYNPGVYDCPSCGQGRATDYFRNIIGIADSPRGEMFISECPDCFQKFYSHTRETYRPFLSTIKDGLNKHFN